MILQRLKSGQVTGEEGGWYQTAPGGGSAGMRLLWLCGSRDPSAELHGQSLRVSFL